MAILRGVSVSPIKIPSALTVGDTTTVQATLGYKPSVIVTVQTITPPTSSGGGGGTTSVATTLTLVPTSAVISIQNGSVQFTPSVKDQNGIPMSGVTVTWTSNTPSVTVNSSGLATGVQTGAAATITASVSGSSAVGTAAVTTPTPIPTTFTVNAGFTNLAATAEAAGWQVGFTINDSYEAHPNYAINYTQMAGAGGISVSEKDMSHWVSSVNTSTGALTTNFSEYTQEFARLQANGTAILFRLLNGTSTSQWTGLSTYVTSSTHANTVLSNVATAATTFFNTPGTPTAYSSGTSYVFGNTVTSGGAKWTCISACQGITPALGAVSGGNYCWLKTQAGTIYAYNLLNEGIGGSAAPGAADTNPFSTQLGAPSVWLPGFAQLVYAGDPAKLYFNQQHYSYDGTGSGAAAQGTAALAIAAAIVAGGSVGGASNIIIGSEAHVICSVMQTTNSSSTSGFNAANLTAFYNSITTAGYGYAITEFDVTDDMFPNSGVNGISSRDAAIATAYINYMACVALCTVAPAWFMCWQLRDPESWLNVDNISPRGDGQPQRPNLLADTNNTQKPSWLAFVNALQGLSGSTGSLVLNDDLPHLVPATLKDQWGFAMPLSDLVWTSSNPGGISVSSAGFVTGHGGGNTAVITGTVGALTGSINASTTGSVLTSLSLSPGNTTLTSGTVTEVATVVDQFGAPITVGAGGTCLFAAGGKGLSANVSAVASISTQIWAKGRILMDGLRALPLNSGAGLLSIDSDGAGTNKKFEVYLQTGSTAFVELAMAGYGTGSSRISVLTTPFVALTGFPANGTWIEWFASWDKTNLTGTVTLYDSSGTIITDGTHQATATGTLASTALNTDGGANGRVTTNLGFNVNAVAQDMAYDGLAIYAGAKPATTLQWSKPTSGDSGIEAAWLYGDATSGTVTSAAALVGSQAQVLTSAQGSVGDANAWSANGLNWSSDNTAVATVSSSGTVTYVSNGVADILVSVLAAPAVTGSAVITCQAAAQPTVAVTVGTSGLTTQNQTTTATAVVTNAQGTVITTGFTLAWSSSNPTVASVTANGSAPFLTATVTCLATGGGSGVAITATIVGSSPIVNGSASVTTPASVQTTLRLSPASLTLTNGTPVALSPTMLDQFGAPMAVGSLTWASSNATAISVSTTGAVQGLAGSSVATITATSSAGPTGTCSASTNTAVLTALSLSPGAQTLSSGTVTEVPTQVDQFGAVWPTSGGGGSVTFTNAAGVGLSTNVAALATTNEIAGVIRMRVDEWTALTGFGQLGVFSLDNGTVGSATTRAVVLLENNGTGLYVARLQVPGLGGITTGNIPAASMPPAGSDVVIYFAWMHPSTNLQRISVYTGAGTNTLIDPNATNVGTANDGSLPTVASGGQVRINDNYVAGGGLCRYQGIALYTAQRPTGQEDKKPTTGDANIAYFCAMSDATSGTSPSTATAQVGTNGLALTASDYTWSADNTTGAWNGTAISYSFTSSSPSVASVNASTGVVTYLTAGTTTVTATYVQSPTITGSCLITDQAASIPTTLTLSPASTSLSGTGSTVSITPTVKDQNGVAMSGVVVSFTSSNTGVVTVGSSATTPAAVTVTYAGVGSATINASVSGGSNPTATASITTSAGVFHEPGGMTTVVNTGQITQLPGSGLSGWSNTSPTTTSATGENAANLTLVAANTAGFSSGLQVNYPSNVTGGYSPVRFGPASWGNLGTAKYYQRMRVRMSPTWTTNGNTGCKLCEPHSLNPQTGGTLFENHVIDTGSVNNTTDAFLYVALQWSDGSAANVPQLSGPQTYGSVIPGAQLGNANAGKWFYTEVLLTNETVAGNGTGTCDLWITDAATLTLVAHYQFTGISFFKSGNTTTWTNLFFDPTYGGGNNSPPAGGVYWQFDEVVCAVA